MKKITTRLKTTIAPEIKLGISKPIEDVSWASLLGNPKKIGTWGGSFSNKIKTKEIVAKTISRAKSPCFKKGRDEE